jgi:hypothetical protein
VSRIVVDKNGAARRVRHRGAIKGLLFVAALCGLLGAAVYTAGVVIVAVTVGK